jgi:hypothetical protein
MTYCVVALADATYVATFKSNDVAVLGPSYRVKPRGYL